MNRRGFSRQKGNLEFQETSRGIENRQKLTAEKYSYKEK